MNVFIVSGYFFVDMFGTQPKQKTILSMLNKFSFGGFFGCEQMLFLPKLCFVNFHNLLVVNLRIQLIFL